MTTTPTAEQLRAHGYAPGGYVMTCSGCQEETWSVDKRALRCEPCATMSFHMAEAREKARSMADKCRELTLISANKSARLASHDLQELAHAGIDDAADQKRIAAAALAHLNTAVAEVNAYLTFVGKP